MQDRHYRAGWALGISMSALMAAAPATAQESATNGGDTLAELVVTAQRRAEKLQDVPIAVSAFSQAQLEAQGIAGGANLQQSVPNVTFSRDAFTSNNFQIRGIGTKVINTSADTATGVHVNEVPIISGNLFEADFFDTERVEVLRGPQGTLYGRNSTGGAINIITAKPKATFEGMASVEVGNYDSRKFKGYLNLPLLDDVLAVRLAAYAFDRKGIGFNDVTQHRIDDRRVYAGRITVGFTPTERFNAYLMYEHFKEDDNRARFSKQICNHDPGPASVGGQAVGSELARGLLSRGCVPTSIYSDQVYGASNLLTSFFGLAAYYSGLTVSDPSAGVEQPHDLRTSSTAFDPKYHTTNDIILLGMNWKVAEGLTLTSNTAYTKNFLESSVGAIPGAAPFLSTALFPGGYVDDPQVGPSNRFLAKDISNAWAQQISEELRLQSDFAGPLNFSLGASYISYRALTYFYFLANTSTAFSQVLNGGAPCAITSTTCVYIDPNNPPVDTGHNYYSNKTPYRLKSGAAFGEVYYQPASTLKLTAGLRYTRDDKEVDNIPVDLLTPGSGRSVGTPPVKKVSFDELTGRVGVDWTPDLAFTDHTLLYAFYSRGYKGGGVNFNVPLGSASLPATFAPEFVNAYEVGVKNTLMGGRLLLNLTGFYYDYKGYQVAKGIDNTIVTENVDAEIKGLEFEAIWEPLKGLRFNASGGLLDAEAVKGSSVDPQDPAAGNPAFQRVTNTAGGFCVANASGVATVLSLINSGVGDDSYLLGICSGAFAGLGVVTNDGVAQDLKGKDLPNAPHWTVSLGAQYAWEPAPDWTATVRGDVYAQGDSYARLFNSVSDRIHGWKNLNLSLTLDNSAWDLQVTAYVRNATNEKAITDYYASYLGSVFLMDPRTYGVGLTKRF